MKVLLVANVAKEHILKFHIPTIRYLKSMGWTVDVACSVDCEIPMADHVFHTCWKRSPFTWKTISGIFQLRRIIRQNSYNIIYCHTPVGGLVARLAANPLRKSGLKVVYCAHGLHFYKGAPLINWLLFYPIEKWLANMTDMFITINPEDFALVQKEFNQKLSVKLIDGIGVNFDRLRIDNPTETRKQYRAKLNIPQDAEVAIYVAEIIKNKNQQLLIRTIKRLHDKGRKMYLLLPGPDHSNGEFKELVTKLGLQDYVKFLGWRSDIGGLMAASDIYLASSIREGFGINLVEAQYCHLPVIAVENRGHKAIIRNGENGFLVPLTNPQMMAERVEQVMTDKQLYARLSNIDVTEYQCDSIAHCIFNYLSELH